jgi:hypothetical protein
MDTKEDRPVIETSEVVGILAGLMGAAGAIVFGFVGFLGLMAPLGSSSCFAGVLVVTVSAVIGGALGSGVVGMFALLCGAKLGPRFSYVFTINVCGPGGPIIVLLLRMIGADLVGDVLLGSLVFGILLGAICGRLAADFICGYRGFSRVLAAVGGIPMFVLGGWLIIGHGREGLAIWQQLLTNPADLVLFLIVSGGFGLLGGSLGAVGGAIIDGMVSRRR